MQFVFANPPFNDPSGVGRAANHAVEAGSYTWSGNWAAVAGIVLCILCLSLWLEMRFPDRDDEVELN